MRRLPLFVLPTVLFPGAQAPLHVFEPRYRQMVARCLEFDRQFGFLFHRSDMYGPFRVASDQVGCIARITEFRPLPDGRSLMLAEGLERFRIEDDLQVAEADRRPTRWSTGLPRVIRNDVGGQRVLGPC